MKTNQSSDPLRFALPSPYGSKSIKAVGVAFLCGISSLNAAVTVVNWTGDYVSQATSLAGDTVAGAGTYEDPDSSGSGAGALSGRVLSLTNAFSPASPYGTSTGVSSRFYGGGVVQDVNGTGNDGFNELGVLNQGGNDSLHLQVTSSGSSHHTLDLLYVWQKQDFLNGTNVTPNLSLTGDGFFHYNTSQAGGGHNDGSYTLRWVVMDGASNNLYVSRLAALGNNQSVTELFSSITGWEQYFADQSTLASLQFDGTSADYDTLSSSLTDIRGFGFLIEHTSPSGPIHTHVEHFQVGAIPEPSRLMLVMGGFLPILLRRRR
jgi:hypothetical protein